MTLTIYFVIAKCICGTTFYVGMTFEKKGAVIIRGVWYLLQNMAVWEYVLKTPKSVETVQGRCKSKGLAAKAYICALLCSNTRRDLGMHDLEFDEHETTKYKTL